MGVARRVVLPDRKGPWSVWQGTMPVRNTNQTFKKRIGSLQQERHIPSSK